MQNNLSFHPVCAWGNSCVKGYEHDENNWYKSARRVSEKGQVSVEFLKIQRLLHALVENFEGIQKFDFSFFIFKGGELDLCYTWILTSTPDERLLIKYIFHMYS